MGPAGATHLREEIQSFALRFLKGRAGAGEKQREEPPPRPQLQLAARLP